jgi:hypothetical protein
MDSLRDRVSSLKTENEQRAAALETLKAELAAETRAPARRAQPSRPTTGH